MAFVVVHANHDRADRDDDRGRDNHLGEIVDEEVARAVDEAS